MSSNPAPSYLNELRAIEKTRSRIEMLFDDGQIVRRDVEVAYEGLFLRAVVGFEVMLEELFFCILRGKDPAKRRGVGPKVSCKSSETLYTMVMGKDHYLDWLPYDRTEQRARRYLYGGRPYTDLDDAERSTVAQLVRIRNAIAHASDWAESEFRSKVIGATPLLPAERSPAGFLRSIVRTGPTMRRFEVYAASLASISAKLGMKRQ